MKNYMRAYADRSAISDDPNEPIRFVASTEGLKSDGKDLRLEDWLLDRFLKHPVILYCHDYFGRNLPLGTGDPSFQDRNLIMAVRFDTSDEFAMKVRSKTVKGMMAASVGWDEIKRDEKTMNELLEMSIVPIPLDPEALPLRQMRSYQDWNKWATEFAEAIKNPIRPYPNEHACRLREPGDFEDGSFRRVEREHEGKKYAVIMGKLKGEDKMTEQAYRYPKDTWSVEAARKHCTDHNGKSFEPATEKSQGQSEVDVWGGVASAMLALFRHSAAMEEEDHKAIYILLERAYRRLGKVAPEYLSQRELLTLSCGEIDGLFLEGEAEADGQVADLPLQDDDEAEETGDERIVEGLEEIWLRLQLFGG